MKILYVEDNDDNIYVVKNRMTRAGFTVLVATDGAQGVTMAITEKPDLILMDMSLPVLDGWEATRTRIVRPRRKPDDIPIIAFDRACDDREVGRRRSRPAATTSIPSRWSWTRLLGKIHALATRKAARRESGGSRAARCR